MDKYFETHLKPLCFYTVVNDGENPFFFESKKTYAVLSLKADNRLLIGCVYPSPNEEKVIFLNDGEFILTEDVVLHFSERLFDGYEIVEKTTLRITRSDIADTDIIYDKSAPLCDSLEKLIAERCHTSPVRLQLGRRVSQIFSARLAALSGLSKSQVFFEDTPLDSGWILSLRDRLKGKSELFYPPFSPCKSDNIFDNESVIRQVLKKDILLSFPYESIEPFITLLNESANDSTVESIKITLYRTANHSRIISALCAAAKNGKSVTACVELRARFDEEHNIASARVLQSAGCRVIYGQRGFKVHSKLCLITLNSDSGRRHISQIGTGNYNEKTAEQYTDFSLITADERIARDALDVFSALEENTLPKNQTTLFVSPNTLRGRVIKLIEDETAFAKSGGEGYLGFKLNGLTDKRIIDKLTDASRSGVKIDLIVRGICCLVSGIEGVSENIRIISIVGRFLEHSRIYIFGAGSRRSVYISSADLMTRNTCRRVEAAVPLLDDDIKKRVCDYFNAQLSDTANARQMCSDGSYIKINADSSAFNSQEEFIKSAKKSTTDLQTEKPTVQTAAIVSDMEKPKRKSFFSWLKGFFNKRKK